MCYVVMSSMLIHNYKFADWCFGACGRRSKMPGLQQSDKLVKSGCE